MCSFSHFACLFLNSIIFSSLIGLVITSTFYDLYYSTCDSSTVTHSDNLIRDVMLSFSIISNTNKLFEKKNTLHFINNYQQILALATVLAHVYILQMLSHSLEKYNSTVFNEFTNFNGYIYFKWAGLWMDTFMIIS